MPLASRKRTPFKSWQAAAALDKDTASPESIRSVVLENGTDESPTASSSEDQKFRNVYHNHATCGTLETTEDSLCFWSLNPQSAAKTTKSRLRHSSIRKGALRKTFGCVWKDVTSYEICDTKSDPGLTLTTKDGKEAIFTFSNVNDFDEMKKIMASKGVMEQVCEKPHLKVSFSDDVTDASSQSSLAEEEEEEDFIAADIHNIDMTPKRLSFLSTATRAPVFKETVDIPPALAHSKESKSVTKPPKIMMIPATPNNHNHNVSMKKNAPKKNAPHTVIMVDTILAVLAVLILVGICLLGSSSSGPNYGRSAPPISVLQTMVTQYDTVETFVEHCLTENPLVLDV